MKKNRMISFFGRLAPAAAAAVLLLSAASFAAQAPATANDMRLAQTQGTVSVTNMNGRALPTVRDMKLSNGNEVTTSSASYAWINLDNSKLCKLDEMSDVSVSSNGKNKLLMLNSGNIYFDVSSPLQGEETLKIRTSTMVTGIRGTIGGVRKVDPWHSQVMIFEGSTEVEVTDPVTGQTKQVNVSAGEMADLYVYEQPKAGDKCDAFKRAFNANDVSGFMGVEISGNVNTLNRINAAGLNAADLSAGSGEKLVSDQQNKAAASANKAVSNAAATANSTANNLFTGEVTAAPASGAGNAAAPAAAASASAAGTSGGASGAGTMIPATPGGGDQPVGDSGDSSDPEPAHIHSWGDGVILTQATCTEPGSVEYTCTGCGQKKTETIPANGHSWSEWFVISEPTCTVSGSAEHKCTVCHEMETEELPALGHDWDEGTPVGPSSSSCDPVEMLFTCKREGCGATKTETVPGKGHDYQPEGDPDYGDDCTQVGVQYLRCSRCGDLITEDAPAYDSHDLIYGPHSLYYNEAKDIWEVSYEWSCSRCSAGGSDTADADEFEGHSMDISTGHCSECGYPPSKP